MRIGIKFGQLLFFAFAKERQTVENASNLVLEWTQRFPSMMLPE